MARGARVLGWLGMWLIGVLALPYLLWWMQSLLWTRTDWRAVAAQPLCLPGVLVVLVAAGWAGWLWLVAASVHDVAAALWRRPFRPRLPASLSGLAGSVAGVVAVLGQPTLAAAHATVATAPPVAGPEPAGLQQTPATSLTVQGGNTAAGLTALPVRADAQAAADLLAHYRVQRGDWLGPISERLLGDFNRYPELQHLNPGLVRNADHIEAGWQLILPADAHDRGPRRHATGATTPAETAPHTDSRAGDATSDATVSPPTTATEPPTQAATTAASATPAPAPAATVTPHVGRDGGRLSRTWLGVPILGLLAAVTVWLRHRRPAGPPAEPGEHHTAGRRPRPPARRRNADGPASPDADTDELDGEPAATPTRTAAAIHHDTDDVDPAHGRLPGSRALTGPGAHDAARGLLITTLTAATASDRPGQVVIPAEILAALFPDGADALAALPQLHVTASLPEAVADLETLLIQRRRDHSADTDEPSTATPAGPPPVLLLTYPPHPDQEARLRAVLHLGAPMRITAAVLGPWVYGESWTVDTDGHTDPPGRHLLMLDEPTARLLLPTTSPDPAPAAHAPASPRHADPAGAAVSADATTPRPPARVAAGRAGAHSAQAVVAKPVPADEPRADGAPLTQSTDTAPDAVLAADEPQLALPVRIQLLGPPVIHHHDGQPVTGLRHHARELLVYLAVHRKGANLPDIMEAIWPTATRTRAAERLSTEAANLRQRIRAAAQARPNPGSSTSSVDRPKIEPIVNTGGRYHLNPDIVDIDLWHLDDALRAAAATADPDTRHEHLYTAVHAHTGVLADGQHYDWIDQPREHARRQGIRARIRLAELIQPTDRRTAAGLLHVAADLDPGHEGLARRAMQASAAIGDTTAVHDRLRRLRATLAAIGETPTSETLALAADLRRQPTPTT